MPSTMSSDSTRPAPRRGAGLYARLRTALACGLIAVAAFIGLATVSVAYADPVAVPDFSGWVVDQTGTLDAATKAQLETRLEQLNTSKGAQLAVLIVPTTGEDTIEGYALRAFEQWRVGRKSVDDGILFLVAKDDRTLRIEVGYGLEGAVPDILAGRIIREQITPHFRQDDYAGGILAGVDSLVGLIQGEGLPPPVSGATGTDDEDTPWFMLVPLAFMSLFLPLGMGALFIGIFVAISFSSLALGVAAALGSLTLGLVGMALGLRAKGSAARASRRGSAVGGLGSTGFGGGGFGGFGGGGGGFGGGGGGSSGGGGASGSW